MMLWGLGLPRARPVQVDTNAAVARHPLPMDKPFATFVTKEHRQCADKRYKAGEQRIRISTRRAGYRMSRKSLASFRKSGLSFRGEPEYSKTRSCAAPWPHLCP